MHDEGETKERETSDPGSCRVVSVNNVERWDTDFSMLHRGGSPCVLDFTLPSSGKKREKLN